MRRCAASERETRGKRLVGRDSNPHVADAEWIPLDGRNFPSCAPTRPEKHSSATDVEDGSSKPG